MTAFATVQKLLEMYPQTEPIESPIDKEYQERLEKWDTEWRYDWIPSCTIAEWVKQGIFKKFHSSPPLESKYEECAKEITEEALNSLGNSTYGELRKVAVAILKKYF